MEISKSFVMGVTQKNPFFFFANDKLVNKTSCELPKFSKKHDEWKEMNKYLGFTNLINQQPLVVYNLLLFLAAFHIWNMENPSPIHAIKILCLGSW